MQFKGLANRGELKRRVAGMLFVMIADHLSVHLAVQKYKGILVKITDLCMKRSPFEEICLRSDVTIGETLQGQLNKHSSRWSPPLLVSSLSQFVPVKKRPPFLPPILSNPEVKDFFPEDAQLSTNTGWRSQVRLRVLEAIGSWISSSEFLHVKDICGLHISMLTASEWEVVLRGFRSSSVLRWMKISRMTWSSEADLESLGLQLGIILNTSSATQLEIEDCRLTAGFFLNLASGLRENSHSKLKWELYLHHAWEEANALKFIFEVLNGHRQLETLSLGSHWYQSENRHERLYYSYFMSEIANKDEAAGLLLSQALRQNSCLEELILERVEGGSAALLLNALAGDDGNPID
ncbi:hypothetical protein AXG93_4520s1050 [Marchantia polymorpha subsp. ruderalis]|uniref:Uncharacterized protein n=1 Tax=Marchantia polymorpha subsp. ruderalis TaxID=1480154 RepID=A0A176VTJ8_MARPO|nr:hypothetical protein AXG93_4520s1050 [Marchantia polymorpha subsp. ruderalis]